jgi:hypothetical protein
MNPLVTYGLINTAVSCALVLLISEYRPPDCNFSIEFQIDPQKLTLIKSECVDQQQHELVIEEDFFLTQLHKAIDLFDLGKKTMAATMARKAATLLRTLIQQIEIRSRSTGSTSWDRRKKGPGVAAEILHSFHSVDARDEVTKRKQVSVPYIRT